MYCCNSDEEWEKWGIKDPYFGVLTNTRYRNINLSQEAKTEFFDTGRIHIRNVMDIINRYLDTDFSPKKILDFGCGVGRLVIPFSEISDKVIGLDVSESMLKEALINCNQFSKNNISLIKSDDELSLLEGSFDLIHSFIVFQHIPIERGMQIFSNLLNHLENGGICAIQFIYSHSILGKNYRLPPFESSNNKISKLLINHVRRFKKLGRNLFKGKRTLNLVRKDPGMQMNLYNLDEIFFLIHSRGITNIHVEFTDHDGVLGCFLYFQKPL